MRPRKHPAARTPMHTRRTRCIARTPTRRPAESSGLEKNDKVTTVPTLKSPPQYHEQYEGWAQALPSSQHSRTFDTVVLYGHHSYTLEKIIAQNSEESSSSLRPTRPEHTPFRFNRTGVQQN